jgi:hypothetical protein
VQRHRSGALRLRCRDVFAARARVLQRDRLFGTPNLGLGR